MSDLDADVLIPLEKCASQIIFPNPDKVFAPAIQRIRELRLENIGLRNEAAKKQQEIIRLNSLLSKFHAILAKEKQ